MKIARNTAVPAAILAAIFAISCAPRATAQRPYQEYWEKRQKEQEPPEIVEDHGRARDLGEEHFLFSGGDIVAETVFPGDPSHPLSHAEAAALENYASGALALESGNPYKALEGFREAAKRNPQSIYLRLRAADIAISLNDLQVAEELVDEALKIEPKNYRAMVANGDISIRRQNYPEATQWYEKALEERPGNIQALLMLARLAYDVERNFERTRDIAQRILHEDDRNLQALLWYAEASAYLGDIEGAATHYGRLLYYRPDLVDRMVEMARRLASLKKADMAIRLYEEALIARPDSPSYRMQWEQLLGEAGDDAVRKGYERLLDSTNNDPEIADLFAQYLTGVGDNEALKALRLSVLEGYPQHIDSLMDLATISLGENDFDAARSFFERVLTSRPNDAKTYREIGKQYLAHGDLVDARDVFEMALLLEPNDVESLNILARIEEWDGNGKAAELLLKRALEVSPEDEDLLIRLGGVYYRGGELAKAEETFRKILETNARDVDAWASIAKVRVETGTEAEIDAFEREVFQKLGKDSAIFVHVAALAADNGMVDRAQRLLEDYLVNEPGSLAARAQLAQVYAHAGEPEKAIETLDRAHKHTNDRALHLQLNVRMAELLETLGRYSRAAEVWTELTNQLPGQIVYQERRIIALINAGQRDAADKVLEDLAAEYGRERADEVQQLRATVYMRTGDPARAISVLKDLLKKYPDNLDVIFQLANAAGDANDLELAEENYRKVLDRGDVPANGYYAVAANNLAYLFSERNMNLDEAEELVEIALKKEPESAIYLDTLAWINFQRGEYEEALEQLQKAAKPLDTDPEIYFHLGQVYEKLGDHKLAYSYYEKALKADPTMDDVRERRDAMAATMSHSKAKQQTGQ